MKQGPSVAIIRDRNVVRYGGKRKWKTQKNSGQC